MKLKCRLSILNFKIVLFPLSLLLLLGNNFAAADAGDQYGLFKLGVMTINKNNADPLFALGGIYGIGISPSFTFEAEFNIAVSGGDYDSGEDIGSYDIWTLAGYVAYRYVFNQTVYLKLKGGAVYEEVDRAGNITNSKSTGFGIAGGAGLGFVLSLKNPVMLELEATATEKDIIFYSLGMTYPF